MQVPYELTPRYTIGIRKVRELKYIADFTYIEDGVQIVEDTKGFRTEVYKIKKKLFEYKYQIEIREL